MEIAEQALEVAQNPKIDSYFFTVLLKMVIAKCAITTSDFETALQAVKRDFGLTERELEILRAFSFEHTNAKIAEELFISENTVKTHIRRMFGKMQCGSRGEAIEEVRKRM